MARANILQEVRQMRFEELYTRRQRRTLTRAQECRPVGSDEPRPARCPWMRRCAWWRCMRLGIWTKPLCTSTSLWHTEHGGTHSSSWTKLQFALFYGPRPPLLAHRRGRGQSRQDPTSRVAAHGDYAHSRLFAGGARPVGVRLPDPAGSVT